MTTAPITIRLLGPFEVLVGCEPADVSGPKRRALVALLALRGGRVVAVDSIVEAIWGDDDLPADPANAVQHHVTRLRKALGAETLVMSPEGYALRGAEVDALRFEELLAEARSERRNGDARAASAAADAALALWGGPPLLGLPDAEWVAAEQMRLEALHLDVLEERFETMLALGEHATLVPELRSALEANPFRERLWRLLMLALYRAGRQADALEAFQEARRMLADELGLEPGPDLQRLQTAILAQDPAIAAPAAGQRPRGNLPAALTSLIGRTELLAEVEALAREARLVTLTGPPGVGKSRVALAVAHELEREFADGAWLVDLGRADAAGDVARLAASVVEAGSSPATGDPLRRVVGRLRDSEALLVLDECERFPDEVGRFVSTVLEACPGVRVLATSREVLHAPGEHRVVVSPLSLPPDGAGGDLEGAEAVRLFVERARAVRPGFVAAPEELAPVVEICRAVDGLPAAIEIAAGRMNVLGLREILAAAEGRLTLLRERGLHADAAHPLSTLLGWSYDLLHADEKTVLHQLAVFRGGADRDALLALAARLDLDEPTVTHLLTMLADKSIVTVSFPDGGSRYHLLTTVREHVLERLADAGELEETKLAHARYFAMLADEAFVALRGSDHWALRERIARDYDNIWAALAYAAEASDAEVAYRLGVGIAWYFVLGNHVSEGRSFVERALAVPDRVPSPRRTELLAMVTYLAAAEFDLDAAIETGEEGLRAGADAQRETALVQTSLALALATAGDCTRAAPLLAGARRVFEGVGDDWAVANCDVAAAVVAARSGDVEAVAAAAASLADESRALDYGPFVIFAVLLEAWAFGETGDEEARALRYREALELASQGGYVLYASLALRGLAEHASAAGDAGTAEELARRAVSEAEAGNAPWIAAHARIALAEALAAAGEPDAAYRTYEAVADWAEGGSPRESLELFFVPLLGSPGPKALLALAELASGAGDDERAESLRARAHALAEAVHAPEQAPQTTT